MVSKLKFSWNKRKESFTPTPNVDRKLWILKLYNFFKKLHSSLKIAGFKRGNLKKRSRRNPCWAFGFTIMEMLLVLVITMVIASITLVGLRSGSAQGRLTRSAARVALDLRRAQNLALTSLVQQGNPVFGYGIYFTTADQGQYIRFVDIDGNNTCNGELPTDPCEENGIGPEILEIVKFEEGVIIDSLSSGPSSLTVNFRSPEPTTFIWEGSSPVTNGIITLTVQGEPTLMEQIFVNDFGLVEFQF